MSDLVLPASDARFLYSGYQSLILNGARVGFTRTIPCEKKYNLDTPGVRMSFRCDAQKAIVELLFKDRSTPQRMPNCIGTWRIDGKGNDRWNFERSRRDSCKNEPVAVKLPVDGEMHSFELFLPYGDIVEIHSVTVNGECRFEAPPVAPSFRCVFFGDSITQGFCASRIDRTFPFLVGDLLDYEVVNMGIAGIGLNPGVAKILGGMEMDSLVVEIGANDWMEGMLLDEFRGNVRKFLHDFRSFQAETPLWWITPFWISPKWKQKTIRYELDEYRKIIAEEVAKRNDPNLHVLNGLELLDAELQYFDAVPLHPVDAGFEQIAERLAEHLM